MPAIPILNGLTLPDTSGNCFFATANQAHSNDLHGHACFRFNTNSSTIDLHGIFRVPDDYAGSNADVLAEWDANSSTATHTARLSFAYNPIAVGEGMDPSSATETVTVDTDIGSGASAFDRIQTTFDLTHGNLAAGDLVLWTFSRVGAHANDDLSVALQLYGLFFSYTAS